MPEVFPRAVYGSLSLFSAEPLWQVAASEWMGSRATSAPGVTALARMPPCAAPPVRPLLLGRLPPSAALLLRRLLPIAALPAAGARNRTCSQSGRGHRSGR